MPEIEVWTLPDCPTCEQVEADLTDAGIPFVKRSLIALRDCEITDDDAMAELILRDGAAPLIRVDGRFISVGQIQQYLQETGRGRNEC